MFLCRYRESAQSLSRETNIDLSRYEVCDNVDLDTVLMDYESYYYTKFARYPKITKKLAPVGKLPVVVSNCLWSSLLDLYFAKSIKGTEKDTVKNMYR